MTETTHEPRRPDDAPAPRYWNVERLTCGMWLTTDYVESGADAAQVGVALVPERSPTGRAPGNEQ